jgi:Xaa-Pro aminopeptidase
MRYVPIEASFYIKNRQAIFNKMSVNSIAVFTGSDFFKWSGDGGGGFRQNSSFFYLTGIDQEACKLVLFKTVSATHEWLFVAETNEKIRIWEGDKLSKAEASKLSGVDEIYYLDEFWTKLRKLKPEVETVYPHVDLVHEADATHLSVEKTLISKLKRTFLNKKFENPARWVNELRVIKDPRELVQIKKAIDISAEAFWYFCRELHTADFEYQTEANLHAKMHALGSRFQAFQTIVASGANSCVLHYVRNHDRLNRSETILLDFGAEYGNYNADITRVVPISGRFSSRQADVYDAVLAVFYALKKYIRPGVKLAEIRNEARKRIAKELFLLKIIPRASDLLIKNFFPHGPSHFLGLDVHDVGAKDIVLAENMIITCEPGIYIPAENLGIRLENDFRITSEGVEDLCEAIPLDRLEVEKLI